jgi:hypothetical protein
MVESSQNKIEIAPSSEKCLIIFDSIHQVMKAEKLLKKEGLKIDLIPMPREVSSDCGIAIELPLGLKREALGFLEEHRLSISACYVKKHGKYEKGEERRNG